MRDLPDELKFLSSRSAVQSRYEGSLAGKTCVVTGATSGVGLAAARRLAAGGADLVLVARDREKARAVREAIVGAAGVRIDIVLADLSDLDQVRRAAGEILDICPRIDVLVNSAGLHSTTLRRTAAGRELVFCVNHLASFLLTSLLLDRLVGSSPSRIIQVNSEGHRFGGLDPEDLDWKKRHYTGLRGYGASKIAQLLTVKEFSDRLAGTGVTINAMHPGDVRTGIGRNNGILYRAFLHAIVWPFLKDSSISGEAIYWLAGDPGLAKVSGRYFHLTIEETPAPAARDLAMGRKIWELSRELTAPGPEIAR